MAGEGLGSAAPYAGAVASGKRARVGRLRSSEAGVDWLASLI
jgi:hypothetical protein